ncbi:uncharacterized protein LOC111623836 [Centruroides sculpturatus]|uniref:uncharacterized protein LOC111623836 n=1 Tax=Centruroides sculpturatus TaxID=218467 RepID=UPI000C6CA765|nr:uncharacterized protein LOC111623836 [Centruroides sculpturatus]
MTTMMYILPLLLGRTFDIRTDKVGVDIFPEEVIRNPEIHHLTTFRSDFKVIRELRDIANLLKIEGELSLKVKAGFAKLGASGSYLKDHVFRHDVVEILTFVYFQTEEHKIPSSVSPISKLNELSPEDVGTHYVKSILYGGELVASFKFRAIDKKDMESIKASVDGALGSEDSINVEVAGKLDKLRKDLEGVASLEISYYGTVPLDGVALTLSGYRDLISKFRDQVKSINSGLGVPIKVQLEEVATLNEKFKFEKNKISVSDLKKLEILFDDLTVTHKAISAWLKDDGVSITKEQENRIDGLFREITVILYVFYETIAKLDDKDSPQHILKAFRAYGNGKIKGIPGKYKKAWESMKQEMIVPETLKAEKMTYVHWGKKNCHNLNTTSLIQGYAATSTDETSPAEILCLPEVPQLSDKAADGTENNIAAVRFGTARLNPFNVDINFENPVSCAVCLGLERSTVVTLAGRTTCPDGWKIEYQGYYVAGRETSAKSQAICVDRNPEDAHPVEDAGKFLLAVTFNEKVIPCVLCSK